MNLIRFYRINEFIHILGFSLLGIFYSKSFIIHWLRSVLLLVINLLVLMYIYSINNLFDRKIDKKSKNFFVSRKIKAIHIFFILLPAFLSIFVSLFASNSIIIIFILLIGTVYSVPPFRLKTFPVIGTLLNPIMFVPFFVLGASLIGFSMNQLLLSVLFCIYSIIAQLVHENLHSHEDRGLFTTAKLVGSYFKITIIFLLLILLFLSFVFIKYRIINLYFHVLNIFLVLSNILILQQTEDDMKNCRRLVKISSILYGTLLSIVFILS
jgi:4-hydroxybenzoate polyprenyltransferase